ASRNHVIDGFGPFPANGQGVAPSSGAEDTICAYISPREPRERMKVARFARNVFVGALVVRLIVRRRAALARERRARRIARLLIAAGGTGVILAAGPLIRGRARRPAT